MDPSPRLRRPVTLPGFCFLLLFAVLLGVGLYKGINLLTLLACSLFGVLFLNFLRAGRRLQHLHGERRVLGPVFAALPFRVEFRFTYAGRRTLRGVLLQDRGAHHQLHCFLPRLNPGETTSATLEVTLPERGAYTWGPLRALSGYPFGLVERERALTDDETVLVFPRLGQLHRGRLRYLLRSSGFATQHVRHLVRRSVVGQSEFHGLRAFRNGDSPRWIHWRTSARCGQLMVREYEDAPTNHLVLVVHLPACEPGTPTRAAVEQALSLAGTICHEWGRQKGDQFVLAIGSSKPVCCRGLTSAELTERLLACLARYRADEPGEAGALIAALTEVPLPAGPIMVVGLDPSLFADQLASRLHRPVTGLNAANLADLGFYEPPAENKVAAAPVK